LQTSPAARKYAFLFFCLFVFDHLPRQTAAVRPEQWMRRWLAIWWIDFTLVYWGSLNAIRHATRQMYFQNETGYCEVRMTADREGYACILYPHARVSLCGGYKEAINVHLAIFPQVGDRRTRGNSLRHGPVMSACPFLSWWHRRGPGFREQSDESRHTMGRMDTRTCPLQQALYILMGFTLLWNTTYGLIRMNDPLHSTVKGKLYCKRSCDQVSRPSWKAEI